MDSLSFVLRRWCPVAILLLCIFALLSCSPDDEPVVLSLDHEIITIHPGDSYPLTASINSDNQDDNSFVWSTYDFTVATVDASGIVKAISPGSTTIVVSSANGCYYASCKVIVDKSVELCAVDMGLSVKWANFNLGAVCPDDAGDYYAWGEVETYYEQGFGMPDSPSWKPNKSLTGYNWPSYRWCKDDFEHLTKYNTSSQFGIIVDNICELEPQDDVAQMKLGGSWRMPTREEMSELVNFFNCTWEWTTYGNSKGYLVTSNITGNSIFLPAAGNCCGKLFANGSNINGSYWSKSLAQSLPVNSSGIFFSPSSYVCDVLGRNHGCCIRPVSE